LRLDAANAKAIPASASVPLPLSPSSPGTRQPHLSLFPVSKPPPAPNALAPVPDAPPAACAPPVLGAPPAPLPPVWPLLVPLPVPDPLPPLPKMTPLDDELLVPICATHAPAWHVCPVGHTAPMQSATQVPFEQCVPAPHVLPTHAGSTHAPLVGSHAVVALHGLQLQDAMQTPLSHT
jgi:hypothetical protein